MDAATFKPVIFLAFANDLIEGADYLRDLPEEARRVGEVLDRARRNELCDLVTRANATAEEIFDVFQDPEYRNRVAVLHFGGHANGYQLLLESSQGRAAWADAAGLAAFLGQQTGLQLVFLNGCSTQPQAQGLLDANVSAVIATSRAIDDQVAVDFASRFYRGLAGGADIRTAYEEAAAAVQTTMGASTRAAYRGAHTADDHWPWDLYLMARDGGARSEPPTASMPSSPTQPSKP